MTTTITTRISNYFRIIKRNYSSALYITGNKAQNNFVVLIPHIDFEERLKNRQEFLQNIKSRKLNINLVEIEKKWNYFCMLNDKKTILETTRDEIAKIINDLKQKTENNQEEIGKLLIHSKMVRDDLKSLRDYAYGIEEDATLSVLELPNVLHEKTPINEDTQVYQFKEKPRHSSENHFILNPDLIEYQSPMSCYLKSDAAVFEYAISNYFQSHLTHLNFVQFSNADFVRSLIIDGCGNSFLDNHKVFTLHNRDDKVNDLNRLHLIGGSSLEAFMAYFARHTIQSSYFPLKLFTYGRKYEPIPNKSVDSLFNLSQQSVVTVFIATVDDQHSLDEIFYDLEREIVEIYQKLGHHFRLVYKAAHNLENRESCRLSIQMFSNHFNDYIEIGNLSIYDDYISKRLLFNYKDKEKVRKFPKIIAGNILNVHKLLGCILENNNSSAELLDEFLLNYL